MARILIAEDDQSLCQFLAAALSRSGHAVTTTLNGIDAIRILESAERFDLLLTDIVMPGMDGIELSRKAAQKDPAIKIMFITGFTAMTAKSNISGTAVGPVISKPFHLNDLIREVEVLLDKSLPPETG